MSTVTFSEPQINTCNIVEQILNQGQRLRNSMVQAILNNDPFSSEYNSYNSTTSTSLKESSKSKLSDDEKKVFQAYFEGDFLSKSEEKKALDTFRNMSSSDLNEFVGKTSCRCSTCREYQRNLDESNDERSKKVPPLHLNFTSTGRTNSANITSNRSLKSAISYLKYVDSIKICVHSLSLTAEGVRRVYGGNAHEYEFPSTYSHTYFVDYSIPECLIKQKTETKQGIHKKQSKVDSGLGDLQKNHIRLCSKKIMNKAVYFKQISIHELKPLIAYDNLGDVELKFNISSRTSKQKNSNNFGMARFNFGSFINSKYLICNQQLSIIMPNGVPILLGTLRVSFQLGCNKLYGKEFINSINEEAQENVVMSESITPNTVPSCPPSPPNVNSALEIDENEEEDDDLQTLPTVRSNRKDSKSSETTKNELEKNKNKDNLQLLYKYTKDDTSKNVKSSQINATTPSKTSNNNIVMFQDEVRNKKEINGGERNKKAKVFAKSMPEFRKKASTTLQKQEEQIGDYDDDDDNGQIIVNIGEDQSKKCEIENLGGCFYAKSTEPRVIFGFVYVPQARGFSMPFNTYFTCELFGQNDVFYSRLVHEDANPVYDFQETIPFLCEEAFLESLRDNYTVFEFWEKRDEESDALIGISQLSTHQLYIAYRNPVIVKYLLKNELPVICTDWWEPICDPSTGETYGHVQLLLALGSQEQIETLKKNRGFQLDSVKNKQKTYRQVSSQTSSNTQEKGDYKNKCNKRQASLVNRLQKNKKEPVKKICCSKEKTACVSEEMEAKKMENVNKNQNLDEEEVVNKQGSRTEEMLADFLKKLLDKNEQNELQQQENTAQQQQQQQQRIGRTSDLLDSLEKALSIGKASQQQASTQKHQQSQQQTPAYQASSQSSTTSYVPVRNDEPKSFRAHVIVESAMHLPSRKKCKSRKSGNKGRNSGGSNKNEEILPSAYVSFETLPNREPKITQVVPKSSNPNWDYRCDIQLPSDLLFNSQKRFILKVWKKCNGNSLVPNPQTDIVIGFAALDLTVLKTGLPNVQGWFNIMDLSGKCNGQIKANVTPLENVAKLRQQHQQVNNSSMLNCGNQITSLFNNEVSICDVSEKADEPSEMLSRALKRKFIELDEITQRLRLRLSKVTNDDEANHSDTNSNDDFEKEFEHDINTLCVEDDYDTINFEEDGPNFCREDEDKDNPKSNENENENEKMEKDGLINQNNALLQFSESHKTDINVNANEKTGIAVAAEEKELLESKQRIANLLEKLSLLSTTPPSLNLNNSNSSDTFSNRYVSGCSVQSSSSTAALAAASSKPGNEGQQRKGLDPDCIINPMLFHELCGISSKTTPLLLTQRSDCSTNSTSSSTLNNQSLLLSTSSRDAPDGEGKQQQQQ